jgi:hypothetical protein
MTKIAPVEVTMHITAAPPDVFPYFTDPARYVQWMGIEAKLDPEAHAQVAGLLGGPRATRVSGHAQDGPFLVVLRLHLAGPGPPYLPSYARRITEVCTARTTNGTVTRRSWRTLLRRVRRAG